MTKDEILEQMRIEMPFHLPDRIRPYIEEAMEIYAQQQVKNCSIAVVSGRSEQFYCADWNRCGSICDEQCAACGKADNMPTQAE